VTTKEHASTCDCSKCYPPGTPRPALLSTFNPALTAGMVSLYGAAPAGLGTWPDPPIEPGYFRPPPPPPTCGVPGCHVCFGFIRARRETGDPNG
jgi:hypothetical protein